MSRILNLGVLAHVDAGKTSLTERILFESGAITALGSVDTGTTFTDTLLLEQQRGITIRAAVASVEYNGCHINLIDTPGHPDFIAEVERSLSVLDAVVLVISSVEGVQPQTRRLARAIRAMGLPCVIFCNKIDRTGAREESLLAEIRAKLGWDSVHLTTTAEIGSPEAESIPIDYASNPVTIETLAEYDDALLASWLEGSVSESQILESFQRAVSTGSVNPVIFGSAVTGAGVHCLLSHLITLGEEAGDDSSPLSAQVFKIDRDRKGERIVLLRIWSGAIESRAEYAFQRDGSSESAPGGKVTRLEVFTPGGSQLVSRAGAGQIVRAYGLADVRIGDVLGAAPPNANRRFFTPVFETVVREREESQRHALRLALADLAEQDPFISLRFDDRAGTTSIRLFGDVQKEVIEDSLLREHRIQVEFEESTVICIERPLGEAEATELITDPENPFAAGVGLRVYPGTPGTGVRYSRTQQSLGKLPHAMYVGIEEAVLSSLREGLQGWEVTDIEIELTHVAYYDPVTVVGDFRSLTPLVLFAALGEAQTEICEPLQQFRLEVPEDRLADAVRYLVQGRAVIAESTIDGSSALISGEIPAASVPAFERLLPGIARGEGDLDHWHTGWLRITENPPARTRTDLNPLDRSLYLSRLAGRL